MTAGPSEVKTLAKEGLQQRSGKKAGVKAREVTHGREEGCGPGWYLWKGGVVVDAFPLCSEGGALLLYRIQE